MFAFLYEEQPEDDADLEDFINGLAPPGEEVVGELDQYIQEGVNRMPFLQDFLVKNENLLETRLSDYDFFSGFVKNSIEIFMSLDEEEEEDDEEDVFNAYIFIGVAFFQFVESLELQVRLMEQQFTSSEVTI